MTGELAGGQVVIELLYLIASVLFILSLKWMSSPTTARHGIWAGEAGMLLAICGTLLHHVQQIIHRAGQLRQDGLVQLLFADPVVEPCQGIGHGPWVKTLAVVLHQGVAHLVDESHGVECPGLYRLRRIFIRSPALVHAKGKLTAGAEIGEDYVAAESKKCLVELITVACFT